MSGSAEDEKEQIRRRIAHVRRRYEGHGRVFRVLWVTAGVTVVIAGLAMTVFPGPAIVVVPLGLAMLAAEFAWARRLLTVTIERGVDVKDRLDRTSGGIKALGVLALACFAAAVAALVVLR